MIFYWLPKKKQKQKKQLNIGMHLDACEWIWFKLGVMIDTSVLYSLLLVLSTLILIQGHRSARKQNILHQLSKKVS